MNEFKSTIPLNEVNLPKGTWSEPEFKNVTVEKVQKLLVANGWKEWVKVEGKHTIFVRGDEKSEKEENESLVLLSDPQDPRYKMSLCQAIDLVAKQRQVLPVEVMRTLA